MLHAGDGAPSHVAGSDCLLDGCLLVAGPLAVDSELLRVLRGLEVLHDFGGRGARICVASRDSGVNRALCEGFVA